MAMGSHLTCFSWLLRIGLQSQSSNNNKNRTHNSKNSFPWRSSLRSLGPSLCLQNWRTEKSNPTNWTQKFCRNKNQLCMQSFLFCYLSSVVSLSFSHDTAMAPSPHHNLTCFSRPTTLKTEHSKIIKKNWSALSQERKRELLPAVTLDWEQQDRVSNGVHCSRRREQKQIVLVLGGHTSSIFVLTCIYKHLSVCCSNNKLLMDGWCLHEAYFSVSFDQKCQKGHLSIRLLFSYMIYGPNNFSFFYVFFSCDQSSFFFPLFFVFPSITSFH